MNKKIILPLIIILLAVIGYGVLRGTSDYASTCRYQSVGTLLKKKPLFIGRAIISNSEWRDTSCHYRTMMQFQGKQPSLGMFKRFIEDGPLQETECKALNSEYMLILHPVQKMEGYITQCNFAFVELSREAEINATLEKR